MGAQEIENTFWTNGSADVFEQRGTIFDEIATKYMLAPLSARSSALSRFHTFSIQKLKSLHLSSINIVLI